MLILEGERLLDVVSQGLASASDRRPSSSEISGLVPA